VDVLIARLSGGGIYIQGQADDMCLLDVGIVPDMELGLTQWALHTVETWCNRVGLLIFVVVCGRRRKLPNFFEPHFVGLL